jgi:hypothetical protein
MKFFSRYGAQRIRSKCGLASTQIRLNSDGCGAGRPAAEDPRMIDAPRYATPMPEFSRTGDSERQALAFLRADSRFTGGKRSGISRRALRKVEVRARESITMDA